MATIGFRCFPRGFAFVVLDGIQEDPRVIAYDKFTFPRNYSWGEKLVWLRKQVLELLGQFVITAAAIKAPEPLARHKSLQRSEVEGVVKEAIYSALGRECTARIKSQLRRDIGSFTKPSKYLEQVLTSRGLAELNNPTYREATLAAIAELPEQE